MVRSRDSEAVPETRGALVDRQRQILIRHYNRTGTKIRSRPMELSYHQPMKNLKKTQYCQKNISLSNYIRKTFLFYN